MFAKKPSFFTLNDVFYLPVDDKKVNRTMTNWIVLTGTGSTGKSTLMEALKSNCNKSIKFVAVDEQFRHHLTIVKRQMTDKEYEKYLVSQEAFDVALKMRLEIENGLDPNECCILDRSVIDTLAYGIEFGNIITDEQRALVKEHIAKFRYKEVYHLSLLPLEDDQCRLISTEEQRAKSQTIFFTQYAKAGYLPIRVSRLSDEKIESIKRRAEIISKGIKKPVHPIKSMIVNMAPM